MTTLAYEDLTATTVTLLLGDLPGGATAVQAQLSPRRDFAWCVAPIFSLPVAAEAPLVGLNQQQTYFARARAVVAGIEQPWSPVVGFRTPLDDPQDTAPAAVMIEPAIIMVPEPPLALYPDSQVAGYPASNLLRDAPVAWHSQGLDLGGGSFRHALEFETAGAPIDCIALLNTNLPESAEIFVGAGPSQANVRSVDAAYEFGPVPARASANLPGRYGYHSLIMLPAAQAHAWWRVTIFASTPGQLLHCEHAAIGLSRRSKNHAIERKESPLDLGSLERARTGVPTRLPGYKMRRAEFELANMTESQYETLYADLFRRVGETEPVLVVPNAKRNSFFHDRILYGNLSGGSAVNHYAPHYSRSLVVDSLL